MGTEEGKSGELEMRAKITLLNETFKWSDIHVIGIQKGKNIGRITYTEIVM